MIELKITVPEEIVNAGNADRYLRSALAAFGYVKPLEVAAQAVKEGRVSPNEARTDAGMTALSTAPAVRGATVAEAHAEPVVEAPTETGHREGFVDNTAAVNTVAEATGPKRERGKPDPASGRTRRTKAEIAEDEAADAADAAAGVGAASEEDGEAIQAETEAAGATADAAIIASTPQDSTEAIAQDEADEAAESAKVAEKSPVANMLLEQVRKLMGEIGKKHGIPFAARIPAYLGKPIAQFSEADLPEVLKKVNTILKLDTDTASMLVPEVDTGATETVETVVEDAPTALRKSEHPATKDELIKALFRYGEYADGTRDQNAMPNTMVDCPQMFKKAFGVEKRSEIPDDKLGEAIALIDDAIATDRFKRRKA